MQAVILAAGQSSRFRPLSDTRHKCLFQVVGDSLIGWTLTELEQAQVDSCLIVQGPEQEIEAALDTDQYDLDISFVVQDEANGMGHALEQCRGQLEDAFLLLNPYRLRASSILPEMIDRYEKTGNNGILLGRETGSPEEYGVLSIDDGQVTGITEKPAPDEAPSDIRVIGIYLLEPQILEYRDTVDEHEYDFEDALDQYIDEHDVGLVETDQDTTSIKYPWDLFGAASYLFEQQESRISDTADIAESATIEGNVVIEAGTRIYENAVIRGPCYIGEDCVIGNNAVVRAQSSLGDGVVIGANSEVRGSIIETETHLHDAFVGDSIIGQDCRIGAGTVFANRRNREADGSRGPITAHLPRDGEPVQTGRERLGAIVGDQVDIGTQANIMPGVMIGAGSTVGPSTCLLKNVAPSTKVYTRFENTRRDIDG